MGKRLIIKGASFITNAIDRITPSTTYYSVIYNLSHCTASNSATSIAAGSTYTVTITAQSGYTLSSVTVRHNGQTVMPTGSGYTYRINSVSGNITVTATATADVTTYTVTYDLENATASNNATTVTAGSSYTVTLTPNSGYTISSATVTHNRVEVTPTSGYTYNIPSVSGNILVECVAEEEQVTPVLPKTITQDDWVYSLEDTCYLVDKTNEQGIVSFRSGSGAAGAGFAIIDVEAYRGNTITVVNSSSYAMRTCMFISSFVPTDIPNMMGESYETSTDVAPYLANGWTTRKSVNANSTLNIAIPSDAKWFYFTYLSSGNNITHTITIN